MTYHHGKDYSLVGQTPHPKDTRDRREGTLSKQEALRRQGDRTAPMQPQSPPSQQKREVMDELAAERSNAVLGQLSQETDERMGNRGIEDLHGGFPGTVTTAGNEANVGHPDAESGGNSPQT